MIDIHCKENRDSLSYRRISIEKGACQSIDDNGCSADIALQDFVIIFPTTTEDEGMEDLSEASSVEDSSNVHQSKASHEHRLVRKDSSPKIPTSNSRTRRAATTKNEDAKQRQNGKGLVGSRRRISRFEKHISEVTETLQEKPKLKSSIYAPRETVDKRKSKKIENKDPFCKYEDSSKERRQRNPEKRTGRSKERNRGRSADRQRTNTKKDRSCKEMATQHSPEVARKVSSRSSSRNSTRRRHRSRSADIKRPPRGARRQPDSRIALANQVQCLKAMKIDAVSTLKPSESFDQSDTFTNQLESSCHSKNKPTAQRMSLTTHPRSRSRSKDRTSSRRSDDILRGTSKSREGKMKVSYSNDKSRSRSKERHRSRSSSRDRKKRESARRTQGGNEFSKSRERSRSNDRKSSKRRAEPDRSASQTKYKESNAKKGDLRKECRSGRKQRDRSKSAERSSSIQQFPRSFDHSVCELAREYGIESAGNFNRSSCSRRMPKQKLSDHNSKHRKPPCLTKKDFKTSEKLNSTFDDSFMNSFYDVDDWECKNFSSPTARLISRSSHSQDTHHSKTSRKNTQTFDAFRSVSDHNP